MTEETYGTKEDIAARLKWEQTTTLTAISKQCTNQTKKMTGKENLYDVKTELKCRR